MRAFVLDYLAREYAENERVTTCQREVGGADLRVRLETGETVAVYIINRAIRLPEIKEKFEQNTGANVHSLFIVNGRMMPDNNAEFEPPHWMAALHVVARGRIYAYWCEGRNVSIRPIHMEWKWGTAPRHVAYGPEVDIANLRASVVDCTSKYLTGSFAMADFGDPAFWQKREPAENYRAENYSWRQQRYSYSNNRRQSEPDESWNPWEEFERHYADVGGFDTDEWPAGGHQQQQERQRPPRRHSVVHHRHHYEVLGVPLTANYDEVKQAYRRKAREYHPDMHPNDKEKYTAKMADINAAFEALSKILKPQ